MIKKYIVELGKYENSFECVSYTIHANCIEFKGCDEDNHIKIIPITIRLKINENS